MKNSNAAKTTGPARVIATGKINLGGGERECFVLEDGTPVLGTSQVEAILGARQRRNLTSLIANIPNASDSLNVRAREILVPGNSSASRANGYVAEDVIDICVAYSNAFVAGALKPQQMHIAVRAISVLNATAKTGIRAMIYEATGYKSPKTLQEHFNDNLRDELVEWSKCFDSSWDETFCNLYRLPYDGVPPRWMAAINHKFYRKVLGDALVDEMQRRNPSPEKGRNHHQQLRERAKGVIEQHIPTFRAIAMTSDGAAEFWRKIETVYNKAPLQLTLLKVVNSTDGEKK